MSKSRNWCFTINNPSDEQPLSIPNRCKLLIANREVGTNGTPHLQGYIEFSSPVALSLLRNWEPTGHYEIRKGTQLEAIKYCLKDFWDEASGTPAWGFDLTIESLEGFGLQTYGIDGTQNIQAFIESLNNVKTSKLTLLKNLIDGGATDKELADTDFDTWARSYRALKEYRLLCVQPRDHAMDIQVIYGPTGTGKSKYCRDTFDTPYWKQRGKWWDNYSQQEVVILDEFYGWLQWDVLLRMCDRYPLMVETKGGQVQFTSKTIVFTSNTEPSQWYKDKYFDAFVRRVSTWIYMPRLESVMKFNDYKDFLNALNSVVYITQI